MATYRFIPSWRPDGLPYRCCPRCSLQRGRTSSMRSRCPMWVARLSARGPTPRCDRSSRSIIFAYPGSIGKGRKAQRAWTGYKSPPRKRGPALRPGGENGVPYQQ